MTNTLKNIKKCLDNCKISYEYNENKDCFSFTMNGNTSSNKFFIKVYDEVVCFAAALPINISKESYPKVIERINNINKLVMVATLYLDCENAQICCQSFAVAPNGVIDNIVILHNITFVTDNLNKTTKDILKFDEQKN